LVCDLGSFPHVDQLVFAISRAFHDNMQKIKISRTNCDSEILELRNACYTIGDPTGVIISYPSLKQPKNWGYGEILTEMLGLNPPIMENFTNDKVKKFMSTFHRGDGRANYSYGERWHNNNSFQGILKRLKADRYSRQAVMNIYDASLDLKVDEWNVPCTVIHQFLVRPDGYGKDRLNLNVYMRSHDLFTGWRFDILLNSYLLQVFAGFLGIDLGELSFFTGSLHVYDYDFDKLKILKKEAGVYGENEIFKVPVLSFEETFKNLWSVEKAVRAIDADSLSTARLIKNDIHEFYGEWIQAYIDYYQRNNK
jgi:thymidylate synthase